MAQVPFQLRISGGEEGKANDRTPFERSFTCTQPIPLGFPKLDYIFLFQTEVKEPGFHLQKVSSRLGHEDVFCELA